MINYFVRMIFSRYQFGWLAAASLIGQLPKSTFNLSVWNRLSPEELG
jgi:hypothetical protein